MSQMFYNCYSLTTLDISQFNAKVVQNMKEMFYNCTSLTELDLSNFDTSSVTDKLQIFYNCNSLTSINLSNLDTTKINNMEQLFYNCQSLKSLDLSSFDTTSVTDMENMFYNCNSLTSIDLSNFKTENVLNMKEMFKNCLELTIIDLSNFDTSKVTTLESMFEGDSNLKYINLRNYKEKENVNKIKMFLYIPENIIYCIIEEENIPNELLEKTKSINNCEDDWFNKCKSDLNIIKEKCILNNIKEISENFFISNSIDNTSIYSYSLYSSIDSLKNANTNLTFFYFSPSNIEFLKKKYGLTNENLYMILEDKPSNDPNSATSDYNYVILLENGAVLKDIDEDFYVEVSVPIRDLDLANFDYAKLFEDQGYDIYNKNSSFYNDFCTPASVGENDIIINDRKKDIYPNNVTLCKDN